MKRRDFFKIGGASLIRAGGAGLLIAQESPNDSSQGIQLRPPSPAQSNPAHSEGAPADITIQIAPVEVEISPSRFISTIGYNGTSPGPVLRMREGKPITVEVINNTDAEEFVHWHGLFLPSEVDGSEEEGTPPVPSMGRRRYQFTPTPAGTRWYHSHAMANGDLHRGTYTGQFGFLMIDSGNDLGKYDQELFLALRDWEPFYTDQNMDTDELNGAGPTPEKPTVFDTRPNGLEATTQTFTINDKMLGFGDPIRVRAGTRVLVHLLNASAIENRVISLPGHTFHILALDGNPVPTPADTEIVMLGPGERADAYIQMNQPGVWILGAVDDPTRNGGLGVVVEYENQQGQPRWIPPKQTFFDYTIFGHAPDQPEPDQTIEMAFEKIPSGAGRFNLFTVNGKPYPHENEFVLKRGARYRVLFRNRTDDSHPLHFHRHTFELVDVNGKPSGGVMKDTVIAPLYGRVSVDLVADHPGLTLFHCHIQQHMDFGFKALFRYG
ncbi:MAG TPA: multicopper oxidase domain-containing protein [Candidatus Aquilonibacter sp.]|nr:multicopper oxidase domain-containing protein [Candidatus Aquilonibacter sp.]